MGQDDPLRGRTLYQFLKSISAYCEWRAASISLSRFDSGRRDYLDAARIVLNVAMRPVRPDVPKTAVLRFSADELRTIALPRTLIALKIAALNPSLDPRILERLPKPKLAKMLAAARLEATA